MKAGTNKVITQNDLWEFRALRAQSSEIKLRYEQERERLLHLVDSHAAVEPGHLLIAVKRRVCRQVTKAHLVSILGEEQYECMQDEAPPTMYRTIVITSQASPPPAAPGEAWPWP